MKKTLSINQLQIRAAIINGSIFIGIGITGLFQTEIASVIEVILFLVLIINFIAMITRKYGVSDEMAQQHQKEACTSAFFALMIGMILLYILGLVTKMQIDYMTVAPFIIGLSYLIYGILYIRLEKNCD